MGDTGEKSEVENEIENGEHNEIEEQGESKEQGEIEEQGESMKYDEIKEQREIKEQGEIKERGETFGKRASWYEVRKEDSDEEEECELCTWVQMNDITCPVCLQREEDMTDLMKHIMFAHDSEEFGNICQECLDEAPWESDSEEVFK